MPEPYQKIEALVNRFFALSPYQKQITMARIRSLWYATMPASIGDRTEKIYVHHHKLYLKITSAPLRYELQYKKNQILSQFQKALPHAALQEVVVL